MSKSNSYLIEVLYILYPIFTKINKIPNRISDAKDHAECCEVISILNNIFYKTNTAEYLKSTQLTAKELIDHVYSQYMDNLIKLYDTHPIITTCISKYLLEYLEEDIIVYEDAKYLRTKTNIEVYKSIKESCIKNLSKGYCAKELFVPLEVLNKLQNEGFEVSYNNNILSVSWKKN